MSVSRGLATGVQESEVLAILTPGSFIVKYPHFGNLACKINVTYNTGKIM